MNENERVAPTVKAIRPDLADTALAEVPLNGTVGTGSVEQLFCKYAQKCVRRELTDADEDDPRQCPERKDLLCGLCGYKQVCVFSLGSPEIWDISIWERIKQVCGVT